MTREDAIKELENMKKFNYTLAPLEVFDMAIKALWAVEHMPTTKNDLGVDCIDRQIISDYVESHILEINTGYGDLNSHTNRILRMIVDYIEKMPSVTPQEPRWIPVSERLPDTDDEVLCWYEYYHWSQEKVLPEYGIGCYFKETSSWFGEVAIGRDVRVLAWMPLPKIYREVEE